MKKFLPILVAIIVCSVQSSAFAHDNLNLNLDVPMVVSPPVPVIVTTPPTLVVSPYDQCTINYNAIVAQEDVQFQNCQALLNPSDRNNCEQNVLQASDMQLRQNSVCQQFYVQQGLISLNIAIGPNGHRMLHRHQRFAYHNQRDIHQTHHD